MFAILIDFLCIICYNDQLKGHNYYYFQLVTHNSLKRKQRRWSWTNGDSPIFRRVISPNGFYSERFLFRKVFIPKGRFSELYLVLWSERLIIRKVITPKILIPKCHCSERFLIRKVLFRTFFFPFFFYSKWFLIRTDLILTGRFSEIRNKTLSDQKLFGSKNFMISNNSPKLCYSLLMAA